MNIRGPLFALSIIPAVLATACDKKDGAPAPAASSGPKAGDPADMKSTCDKMCDKTVECAEDMAKSEGAPDETVKSAKAMAKESLSLCKTGCAEDADKASDKDKAQAAKMKDCLGKSCPDYVKCVDAIE